MSPLSQESSLVELRKSLAQMNTELYKKIKERRSICLQIQHLKQPAAGFSFYDPDREKKLFTEHLAVLNELSLKEILAFSLIMEDQAQTLGSGSYPSWSEFVHLDAAETNLVHMINPLLVKVRFPELFSKLNLNTEFNFLREF